MKSPLLLSSADVARCLDANDARALVRHACLALAAGEISLPPRALISASPPGTGTHLVMSARDEASRALSTKLISVCPSNAESGLPTSFGLLILQDAATGQPRALIHSPSLTARRTAALVALSVETLARPNATRAVLFGAGPVAAAILEAVTRVHRFQQIDVITRHRESASSFVEAHGSIHPGLAAAPDPEAAVRAADVILAATTASEPLFDGNWVAPGAHLAAVGAFTPTTRELASEVVERATIVVDTREGAREEAGDLLIPLGEGRLDERAFELTLAEVLTGAHADRQREDEITIFKSVGSAAFDVGVAAHIEARARELGLGTPLELG